MDFILPSLTTITMLLRCFQPEAKTNLYLKSFLQFLVLECFSRENIKQFSFIQSFYSYMQLEYTFRGKWDASFQNL